MLHPVPVNFENLKIPKNDTQVKLNFPDSPLYVSVKRPWRWTEWLAGIYDSSKHANSGLKCRGLARGIC